MRRLLHAISGVLGALAILGAWLTLPAHADDAATCVGDCVGDSVVSLEDLILGIVIALGAQPASVCPAADNGMDQRVTVDELIQAVRAALGDCAQATPTPPESMAPSTTPTPTSTFTPTPPPTASPGPPSPAVHFCDLPGSVQTTAPGVVVVPGGPAHTPDLRFMQLPIGFCAHFFANVGNARQLRFAPGGELFVASPTTLTTGGGAKGKSAIVVLADDDGDGVAEVQNTFLGGLPSTQGLLFTGGYLYYQDRTRIRRLPYTAGDRTPTGSSEEVVDVTVYSSGLHWPKALDVADDGTIYVTNGGDQSEACDPTHPFHGGILALDGSPGGKPVAKGFRNPISIRCERGHNLCFAVELAKDFTAAFGGREKVVPIREGDDWGFPCCASKDLPYGDVHPIPSCSQVAAENTSFFIGGTPFDLDFERGVWPAPWTNRAFVPLHGAYGFWEGARLVAIERDAMTGDSLPGTDLGGMSSGAMADFATGWGDRQRLHGRPANVAFASDGRLFLGNDNSGDILWIAPMELPIPGGAQAD